MRAKLTKSLPVYLQLQQTLELQKRLHTPLDMQMLLKLKNGRGSPHWTLSSYISELVKEYPEKRAGTYVNTSFSFDEDIVKAVELFGTVELEDYQVKQVVLAIEEANTIQKIIQQENL